MWNLCGKFHTPFEWWKSVFSSKTSLQKQLWQFLKPTYCVLSNPQTPILAIICTLLEEIALCGRRGREGGFTFAKYLCSMKMLFSISYITIVFCFSDFVPTKTLIQFFVSKKFEFWSRFILLGAITMLPNDLCTCSYKGTQFFPIASK